MTASTAGLSTCPGPYSFYMAAANPALPLAAKLAPSITIAGPKGPAAIRTLRDAGVDVPVTFDGMGYKEGTKIPPPEQWAEEQRRAGATRVLLPGRFLAWEKEDLAEAATIVAEETVLAHALDAVAVFAVDAKWIARRTAALTDLLVSVGRPVAIVPANAGDPLALAGAVTGLRWLATRVPSLTLLRSDHGAIGAVAFGADHAALGLTTSTRHFVTRAMNARRAPGRSARLFVRQLLDWFRASEIAGWSAAAVDIRCFLPCCGGQSLDRFLDEDLDGTWHNLHALADFADVILGANREDRGTDFLAECRDAVARYGYYRGPEAPKSQLTGWALS